MTRSTIARLFFGSLLALVAGLVLSVVAVVLGTSTEGLIMRGPDVVGVHSTGSGVTIVLVAGLAVLLLLCAAVAQFIAWIGAVISTSTLPDKTWFVVLLIVGLLGFVLIANVLYLVGVSDVQLRAGETRVPASLTN